MLFSANWHNSAGMRPGVYKTQSKHTKPKTEDKDNIEIQYRKYNIIRQKTKTITITKTMTNWPGLRAFLLRGGGERREKGGWLIRKWLNKT